MGCGGSQPAYDTDTPNPLQTVASISTGVGYHGTHASGHIYVVDERNVFVVGGKGVAVLDISDPTNVMCVAKVKTGVLYNGGGRIAMIPNSKVALLTGTAGLCVLDISDPPNTKVLKVIKQTPVDAECGRVAIVDAETALIVGQLGVGVLDISNPQNVEQVAAKVKTGVMSSGPGATSDVARVAIIPNSKVALVTGGKGLCVLDVSDPPNAKVLKVFKNNKKEIGVPEGGKITFVDAQTALVVGGVGGLAVLDIADPQNVQVLSRVDPKVEVSKPGRQIILGSRALVQGRRGLAVVDFTDRANVKTLAKVDTKTGTEGGPCCTRYKLMADGRHVLMTGGYGAAIVDISDLSVPAKVGATINTGVLTGASDAGQILVLEEYALVVGDGRVATIGIKDLTNPKVMKPVSFEGEGRGTFHNNPGRLVAIGNMHFLLVSSHGVYVLKMTASA